MNSSVETELRGAQFARLWAGARAAYEASGGELGRRFAFDGQTPTEQRALQGLLGRASKRPSLLELDAALRSAVGRGLAVWLTELGGPLRDRPAERFARATHRANAEGQVLNHRLSAEPWFEQWWADVRADGTFATAARFDDRGYLQASLALLDAVLRGGHDRTPLAVLAGSVTGDTKRLGSSTVRAMVERALSLRAEVDRPADSATRRALWRSFGIIVDDVSSDVLVLNVRPSGSDRLSGWLREAAEVGEPFRITLRQLSGAGLQLDQTLLSICENPSVLMDAAERLGPGAALLICTDGVPTDAVWHLLEARSPSTTIRIHADFDAAGCAIAGSFIERVGAVPWRFDATSYLAALARFGAMQLPPSKGTVGPTPWDPALSDALAADGRAVYEELLIDDLIADLRWRAH